MNYKSFRKGGSCVSHKVPFFPLSFATLFLHINIATPLIRYVSYTHHTFQILLQYFVILIDYDVAPRSQPRWLYDSSGTNIHGTGNRRRISRSEDRAIGENETGSLHVHMERGRLCVLCRYVPSPFRIPDHIFSSPHTKLTTYRNTSSVDSRFLSPHSPKISALLPHRQLGPRVPSRWFSRVSFLSLAAWPICMAAIQSTSSASPGLQSGVSLQAFLKMSS